MTIQDVKQIKLADYLQSLGYTPVKQQGRNCLLIGYFQYICCVVVLKPHCKDIRYILNSKIIFKIFSTK